jgi:aminopeptidase N
LREHRDKGNYFKSQVAPMLQCYENYFGPYPFSRDGYQLVESPFAGMEHQSAIAYGNAFQSGYGGMRMSNREYDYIVIHESGHEWWGNYVSCGDLADMWIHESFTTYGEALYFECLYGKKEGDEWLWKNRRFIENQRPIIGPYGVRYDGSKFDTDMYYKGAWVLQTLRSALGNDDLFFKTLKEIQKECHFKAVNADDILKVMNHTTGTDLTPFFTQYFRTAKIPLLQIKKIKRGKYGVRFLCEEKRFGMVMDFGNGRTLVGTEWKEINIKADKLKSDSDLLKYYLINIERL